MTTLRNIITNLAYSTRTGPADGVTARGEYWLVKFATNKDGAPSKTITVRAFKHENDRYLKLKHRLEIRHYRSGEITATLRLVGELDPNKAVFFTDATTLLEARSVAEAIALIKGLKVKGRHAYGIPCGKWLLAKLTKLGLPAELPAPGPYNEALPVAPKPYVAQAPAPEPYVAPRPVVHPASERFARY